MKSGIWAALGAAVLFGLSTPLAKLLTGQASPLLLAGLLYTGSGIGLTLLLVVRVMVGGRAGIVLPRRVDLGWLLGGTLFGGAIGPYLLMYGLQATDSASASLILNLEGVFSALLAWFVFKENFDRRIALGMALIVAGGLSRTLFVVALRNLGTARTGAYFSLAPFIGAALALALGAPFTWILVVASLLMGAGLWLHLHERHSHRHIHESLKHAHSHTHDAHHRHQHDNDWRGQDPHTHEHIHELLEHAHPHYPGVHHRHPH
jgi:drug/metabolite transporter (DMT)-like permease